MFNYEIISLFAPIENGCVRYYIMKTAVEKHDNDIQKSFQKDMKTCDISRTSKTILVITLRLYKRNSYSRGLLK